MRRVILSVAVLWAVCASATSQGAVTVSMRGDDDGFGTGIPLSPGDDLYAWGPKDADGFDGMTVGGSGDPDFSWTHSFAAFSSITSASLYVQTLDFPETGTDHGAGTLWIDGSPTTMSLPPVEMDQTAPWTVHGATFDLGDYFTTLRDGSITFGFSINTEDGYSIDYARLTIEGTLVSEVIKHTIAISSTSGGSVSSPGIGSFEYDHGTSVPIIATAQANCHFTGWTGTAVDAGKVADPALASTTIMVDADYALQANFAIDQRALTISAGAGGVVSAPGEGTFDYDYGTEVLLQAEPYPLFVFAGWRGEIFSGENPMLTTMNSNRRVRACFESVLPVLYVDDDASGDPGPGDPSISDPSEDGTLERPFDTVQEAIDVAKPGARIIVRPGTYFETIDLLGKSIEVTGLDESDPNIAPLPIIDGGGKDTVVKCTQGEDPNCVLRGLVITGGKGQLAGGILCMRSNPTVRNCLIVGNRATGLDGGGGIDCRASSALFVNCTVSGNCGGSAGAGVCFSESTAVLSDSILWENPPTEIRLLGSGNPIVAYTVVAGGWPGPGNLDVDPLFALAGYWANPADLTEVLPAADSSAIWVDGDYHLLSEAGRWDPFSKTWAKDPVTSPCIDAGDPAAPTGAEPSPNGGRANLGVYGGTNQASMSTGNE